MCRVLRARKVTMHDSARIRKVTPVTHRNGEREEWKPCRTCTRWRAGTWSWSKTRLRCGALQGACASQRAGAGSRGGGAREFRRALRDPESAIYGDSGGADGDPARGALRARGSPSGRITRSGARGSRLHSRLYESGACASGRLNPEAPTLRGRKCRERGHCGCVMQERRRSCPSPSSSPCPREATRIARYRAFQQYRLRPRVSQFPTSQQASYTSKPVTDLRARAPLLRDEKRPPFALLGLRDFGRPSRRFRMARMFVGP
jgi:hypothetical protein